MSGSEHSNSSSPRYCPTPHQMPHPVPSPTPPPVAMMHQVMPGHAQGHGHHTLPSQQQMNYYGYHNTPAQQIPTHTPVHHQQAQYYGAQNPATGYYHHHQPPPHPSHLHHQSQQQQQQQQHIPPPQNGYGQSVQWQSHHQGYYSHGYGGQPANQYVPPQQQAQQQQPQQQQQRPPPQHHQQQPPPPPMSPHHHQQQQQQQQQHQQIPRPGSNAVNYSDRNVGQGIPPQQPSSHGMGPQTEHVMSTSDAGGQHALMNLSRFVNQNQRSVTENRSPVPVNVDTTVINHSAVIQDNLRSIGSSIPTENITRSVPNLTTTAATASPVASLQQPQQQQQPRPSPPKSTVTTVASSPTTTTTPVVSPASSVISSSGGGQTGMMPVRLQNARGARTKASMRKMLMEQTAESSKPETTENMEEPPAKRARRKPKGADDSIDSPASSSASKASERKKSAPKSESPKRKSRSPKPSPTPATKGSKKQGKQTAAAASPSLESVESPASSAPKKRGSRKSKAEAVPEIPDPSSSVNNVEEEIAKVLLDLKTGKSSPEKTGDVKIVEPPQEEPKKRQRRSSVRSIVESSVEETPTPKGKKKAAKSVAKGTKASKSKSAAAASPKTPKGKKSKTILAQSEQAEPAVPSSSVMLSGTEPIEEDFPVIHIPEVHSDTLIVVQGAEPSAEPLTLMSAQLDFGNVAPETSKILSSSTPPVNINPPTTAAVETPAAKPRRKSGAKKSEKAEEKPKETPPKKQRSSKKKEPPTAPSPDEELPDLEPLDFTALIPPPPPPPKKSPKKEKKVSEGKAKKPKGPKKGAQAPPPAPVEPEPESQEFPVLSISEDTGISTIVIPSSKPAAPIAPKPKGKGKKAPTPKAKSPKIAKPKAPRKSKKSKAAEVKEHTSAVETSPVCATVPVNQEQDQSEELTQKGNKKRKRSDTPKRQRQASRKKKPKLEEDMEEASGTDVLVVESVSQPFEEEALTANVESKPEPVIESDTDIIERPSKTSKSPIGKSKTKAVKGSPGVAKGAKTKRTPAKAAKSSKQIDIGTTVATTKSPKSKKAKGKTEQNEQPADEGDVLSGGPSPAAGKKSRAKADGATVRGGKSTHDITTTKVTKSTSELLVEEPIPTTPDLVVTDVVGVKSPSETPAAKGKKGKKVSPEITTPKVSKRAEKKVKPAHVETESTPTPERGRKKTPVRTPKAMAGASPGGEVEAPKSQKGKSPKRSVSPKKEAGTPKHAEEHVRVSRRASSAGKSTASTDQTETFLTDETDEVILQENSVNLLARKSEEVERPIIQPEPVAIAVPPKKRFSKYDRATLDTLENETIMEVSKAAEDPLPPMEFFYQFEYSQRNNYPPSLPAPAKRKHAQLEARKMELMNELNQMSTSTTEIGLPKQPVTSSKDTLPTTEERTPVVGAKEKKASLALSSTGATVGDKVVKKDRRQSTASQPVEKQAAVVESENVQRSPPQEEGAGSVNLSFIPAIAKPIKAPTVFVKSAPLGSSNMRTASSSSGDTDGKKKGSKSKKGPVENGMKHKTHKDAPSLRVEKGQVKFYRGGEEEDVEPPATKLRSERPTDSFDSKVPWLCTFCKLGPHVNRLGDLFGPYFVNVARENHQEVTKDSSSNGPGEKGMKTEAQKRETWMHQDCALWASDLLLIGTSIRGLDKAVYEADRVACTICGQKGATIGCLTRKCGQAAHFPCAQKMQWELDDETFLSYCSIHCKPPSLPL